jgi:hypothetical protein
MPVKLWQAPRPLTPFAPQWTVPFYHEGMNDPGLCAEIARLVLAKEAELKRTIKAIPISGIEEGLTARWHGFNTFRWEEPPMRRFQQFVKRSYLNFLASLKLPRRRCYIQGWANVVRGGEQLTPHCHDQEVSAYLSGNFCAAAEDTATLYFPPFAYQGHPNPKMAFRVPNEVGMVTFFPSTVFHCTTPHQGTSERVTLAFDIHIADSDALNRPGSQGLHVLFDDPALDSAEPQATGQVPVPQG